MNWIKFVIMSFCISLCICGSLFAQSKTVINSIGMEFMLIPAGSFMMGSDKNSEKCDDDETPLHKVRISKAFYLSKYEVTQEQWFSMIEEENHCEFKGKNNPVEMVSPNDINRFITSLQIKESRLGYVSNYRLPTEAEWEYACRAGTTTPYSFGDNAYSLGQYGWYHENSEGKTHPVGQLKPNAWGLYDMHGNVSEWCKDYYGYNYYSESSSLDPERDYYSNYGTVIRGGSWQALAVQARSANRFARPAENRHDNVGFRLVLEGSYKSRATK